jgi:hypothetical protein
VRRWLFNVAALVSLVLAIAGAVEFFLSYRWTHAVAGLGKGYGVAATCKVGLLLGFERGRSIRTRWLNVPAAQVRVGNSECRTVSRDRFDPNLPRRLVVSVLIIGEGSGDASHAAARISE